MGKRFGVLCAAGLASLLSFSQPATAQEPLVARAIYREVPTRTIQDAALTVGVHSVGAALYARRQGHGWKNAFLTTAGLRLGMEGGQLLNNHLLERGHSVTTGLHVLGQVVNSAQVNVMHGQRAFSELEVNYLLARFQVQDGTLSVRPHLKPLLGAAVYAFSDASFSLERSVSSGVLVFTYENPEDTRLNRLLFESRTASKEDEFVTMHGQGFFDGVVAVHTHTQQLGAIRDATLYLREHSPHSAVTDNANVMLRYSARNTKRAVMGTLAHEIVGHQQSHDFHHKLLNAPERVPWWVGVDISFSHDRRVRVPVLSTFAAMSAYFFPELNFEENVLATTSRPGAYYPSHVPRKITLFGAR